MISTICLFDVKSGPVGLSISSWEAVPPIRSVFPDYGPFPDFFEEIGPDLVRILCEKSDFLLILLYLVIPAALPAIE